MSNEYMRVIPRDLFNEASLLKCLGRVYINLETANAPNVELEHDGGAFEINQHPDSGGISANVCLIVRGKRYQMFRPLNSRSSWPLYLMLDDDDILVFTDEGEFTPEFQQFITEGG